MAQKTILDKLSIYVPQSKAAEKPVERLIKRSEKRDRSINYLVDKAILEYLERERRKRVRSAMNDLMEPETILAILSAPLMLKFLGPSVEYLGEQFRDVLLKKGVENLERILKKGIEKVGNKIEQPGDVPLRVLRAILQEGPLCDDALSAEYFAGVLASSRSGISRDDRGVVLIALLSRLSTYQIRSHFVFYQLLKGLLDGESLNVTKARDANAMEVRLLLEDYLLSMDMSQEEDPEVVVPHVLFGLKREDLLHQGSKHYWDERDLKRRVESVKEAGLLIRPSPLGIELFLSVYGQGSLSVAEFLRPDFQFPPVGDVSIPLGATKTTEEGIR